MDAPESLQHLSNAVGVHSTHLQNPESMQELAQKTSSIAAGWRPLADTIFRDMPEKEKKKIRLFKKYLLYRDQ